MGSSSRSPSAASSSSDPPPPPKKSYARSIRSVASVKTLAASLASFYTFAPGSGPRQAKRRRAPRSELGRPAFTSRAPELQLVDGVEMCVEREKVSGVTCVRTLEEGGRARVSLLVNHFAELGLGGGGSA